ncbi:hypothetical protein ACFFX0_01955 [Citricoccus parietis]|uniref:Uncharacterized protein n=1 Tax=Citricoccus parietis TaxID=592307 RepID=A0ABV5FTL3_9MICC
MGEQSGCRRTPGIPVAAFRFPVHDAGRAPRCAAPADRRGPCPGPGPS